MNKFLGFPAPEQNFSKLPHVFIDLLSEIESLAELKVTLYVLRHTWGFSEYDKPKKITTDEFEHGRKRRDGTRIDNGTGLSTNSVRAGLERAVERGTLRVEIDESDKARIEKWYCLNMKDESNFESRPAKIAPRPAKIEERTEKETLERKNTNHPANKTDETKGEYNLGTTKITSQQAEILKNAGMEWLLLKENVTEQEIQAAIDSYSLKDTATKAFEAALGFSKPLPWWQGKDWTDFAEWVVAEYKKSRTAFGEYNIWRNTPYIKGGMANTRIRGFVTEFYDSWDMFLMSKPKQVEKEETRKFPTLVNGRVVNA